MQFSHRTRDFDVDRILISESTALHAQNKAKLFDMGGEIRQGERDLLSLVEIVKFEGLEVADQYVARPISLSQAVEILSGLPVGKGKIAASAFLLDDQDAWPEQVNKPRAVIQSAHMLFHSARRNGVEPQKF